MHPCAIAVFLAWIALTLAPPARSGEQAAVLFWRITPAADTAPETAEDLEKQLRAGLSSLKPGGLLAQQKVERLLTVAGNERFLGCGRSVPCLAELGLAAGAATVMTGFLEKEKDHLVSDLLVIDATKKAVLLRARIRHGHLLDAAALDLFSRATFSPERFRGRLSLECPVAGAEILLDGKPAGTTPLDPPLETTAGLHQLEVRKAQHLSFSREVDIPLAGTCFAVALLPEQPRPVEVRPFYQRWPFWTLAGVGAAAMVAGGVLYHDMTILRRNADQAREAGLAEADYWEQRADSRAIQAYVAFAAGGAGLLAAVIIAVIDLASGGEDTSVPSTPSMSSVTLLPIVSW